MLETLLKALVVSVVMWAQPYAKRHDQVLSVEQTMCLTEAAYFESRGEGPTGMTAVAYAVRNRTVTRDRSICNVVHEPAQFSFYNPRHMRHPKEVNAWIQATFIAVYAQLGVVENPVGNATRYNTTKMSSWTDARVTKKVNHHYFYVERDSPRSSLIETLPFASTSLTQLQPTCLLSDPRCNLLYHGTTTVEIDPRLRTLIDDPVVEIREPNHHHHHLEHRSHRMKRSAFS